MSGHEQQPVPNLAHSYNSNTNTAPIYQAYHTDMPDNASQKVSVYNTGSNTDHLSGMGGGAGNEYEYEYEYDVQPTSGYHATYNSQHRRNGSNYDAYNANNGMLSPTGESTTYYGGGSAGYAPALSPTPGTPGNMGANYHAVSQQYQGYNASGNKGMGMVMAQSLPNPGGADNSNGKNKKKGGGMNIFKKFATRGSGNTSDKDRSVTQEGGMNAQGNLSSGSLEMDARAPMYNVPPVMYDRGSKGLQGVPNANLVQQQQQQQQYAYAPSMQAYNNSYQPSMASSQPSQSYSSQPGYQQPRTRGASNVTQPSIQPESRPESPVGSIDSLTLGTGNTGDSKEGVSSQQAQLNPASYGSSVPSHAASTRASTRYAASSTSMGSTGSKGNSPTKDTGRPMQNFQDTQASATSGGAMPGSNSGQQGQSALSAAPPNNNGSKRISQTFMAGITGLSAQMGISGPDKESKDKNSDQMTEGIDKDNSGPSIAKASDASNDANSPPNNDSDTKPVEPSGEERQASNDSTSRQREKDKDTTMPALEDLSTVSDISQLRALHQKQIEELRHHYERTHVPKPYHKERVKQLTAQTKSLTAQIDALTAKTSQLTSELSHRQQEYQKMESNYFSHLKSLRATDDDFSTIREKFHQLRNSLTRLSNSLPKKEVDRMKATQFFLNTWPDLREHILALIGDGQKELEPFYIHMLTEKFIMDNLILWVFLPYHLGTGELNAAFPILFRWLDERDPAAATRLRQQLAVLVANPDDVQTQAQIRQAKETLVIRIFEALCIIYPSIRNSLPPGSIEKAMEQQPQGQTMAPQTDANANKGEAASAGTQPTKPHSHLIRLVSQAVALSLAIRGQPVEIQTRNVVEGRDSYDPELMELWPKSNPDKLVRICVCPPFVGGDAEHGFLEKGRVFCG
ncbi:hypothetical protein BZG36_00246 [Bifiguratus adelaidae]|uniref:Uncharacterized protein n=1 Tax=Bifiguratus adelaidae TaxID=1938954 RepID=A0A261Y8P4_9FUNG|nr:hypothetical protein BZG36_00246 [Bifiguratus adelaidae]